ncbi:hypothetical protein B5F40_12245 [Gordonibacter sp. An230]|nr:hypothetical protein B5F40_12245 [Gordonibacter sp. An230]
MLCVRAKVCGVVDAGYDNAADAVLCGSAKACRCRGRFEVARIASCVWIFGPGFAFRCASSSKKQVAK